MDENESGNAELLSRLIQEQERDKSDRYVYSEKISPRRPVLFVRLSSRQKACLILALFMKRSEIGQALKIRSSSVTQYVKYAIKKLPEHEIECIDKIRSAF